MKMLHISTGIGNICACSIAMCGSVTGTVALIFNKPYQEHIARIVRMKTKHTTRMVAAQASNHLEADSVHANK
ncbi:hypothetical protein Y032_0088g2159 [Ancylostoma ceylanicum]|nr:hypothetical protein Y032_0088g2159 [Ancylostoma ceylanicum]